MSTQLEHVIPLPQAAKRMGLSVEVLTRMVHNGIIRGVTLPNGDIAVNENETEVSISRADYERKFGDAVIGIRAAAKQYQVHVTTIARWVKAGYIAKVGDKLLEAHVAYCCAVYERRKKEAKGQISGMKIFDKAGRPYKPRKR